MLRSAIDRLAIHKGVVRSRGYRVNIVRVGVVKIVVAVAPEQNIIVEVSVVDIYAAIVAPSAVIPRMERLTPSKWEPAETAAPTPAKADAETNSESAEPANKRRSIERRGVNRARAPTPVGA